VVLPKEFVAIGGKPCSDVWIFSDWNKSFVWVVHGKLVVHCFDKGGLAQSSNSDNRNNLYLLVGLHVMIPIGQHLYELIPLLIDAH
jgi:hypothetical protein